MSVITLRLPDDQHGRLKDMAKVQGISLNKLFEQLTARILTENDIELRYRRLAASGSPERGLELLDRIEKPAETAPRAPRRSMGRGTGSDGDHEVASHMTHRNRS